MQITGTSIHHVAFDARRQRFLGAVAFGGNPEVQVSVPGHRAWTYRQIADAMIAAGRRHVRPGKGSHHDHP